MKILALSGSLRANSYNTSLVKHLGKLPLLNPDLDIHTLEEDNSPKNLMSLVF